MGAREWGARNCFVKVETPLLPCGTFISRSREVGFIGERGDAARNRKGFPQRVEVKGFGIVADVFQVRLCSGLRTRQGWGTVPAYGNLEGRGGEGVRGAGSGGRWGGVGGVCEKGGRPCVGERGRAGCWGRRLEQQRGKAGAGLRMERLQVSVSQRGCVNRVLCWGPCPLVFLSSCLFLNRVSFG